MKPSLLLVLVLATVALATPQPQRSRSLFPRRRENSVTEKEEPAVEAAPDADPVVVEEADTPRFRIRGNRPSSFTPRRSASSLATPAPRIAATTVAPTSGRPLFVAPVSRPAAPPPTRRLDSAAVSAALPVAPTAPRTRSRGSITFIESMRYENLLPSQIEGIKRAQETDTRPAGRPSSRNPSVPSRRPSSRPSSSKRVNDAVTTEAPAKVAPATQTKPNIGNQASRRQRLLQLKMNKRPRVNLSKKSADTEGEVVAENVGKQMMSETTEVKESTQKTVVASGAMTEEKTVPKLDEQVEQTLDEAIKVVKEEADGMGKQMTGKIMNETADTKMKPLDAAVVEPEVTTTTTAAPPATTRRVSTLARIRANRPASRPRTSRPSRQRASTPVVTESESPAPAAVTSQTTARRGSRVRGAAAPSSPVEATPSRFVRPTSARVSSRGNRRPRVRAPAAADEEATPAATGRKIGGSRNKVTPLRRRKFQSLSSRFSRTKPRQNPAKTTTASPTRPKHEGTVSQQQKKVKPTTNNRTTPARQPQLSARRIRPRVSLFRIRNLKTRNEKKATKASEIDSLVERIKASQTESKNSSDDDKILPTEAPVQQIDDTIAQQLKAIKDLTGSVQTTEPAITAQDLANEQMEIFTEKPKPIFVAVTVSRSVTNVGKKSTPPVNNTSSKPATEFSPSYTTEEEPLTEAPVTIPTLDSTPRRKVAVEKMKTKSPTTSSTTGQTTTTRPITPSTSTTTRQTTRTRRPTTSPPATRQTTTTRRSITPSTSTTTRQTTRTRSPTTSPPATRQTTTTNRSITPSTSKIIRKTTTPTTTRRPTTRLITPRQNTTPKTTRKTTTSLTTTRQTTTTMRPTTPSTTTIRRTTTRSSTTRRPMRRKLTPLAAVISTRPNVKTPPNRPTTAPTTTETTTTTIERSDAPTKWRPRVAPENLDDAMNRGGFRFQPHESSDVDIKRIRGEVILTEVGTLEDTPPAEVRAILSGLGSRRRGLARPSAKRHTKSHATTTTTTTESAFNLEDYYYYDYE